MGQPKSNLRILGIKPDQKNQKMGISFKFNQLIQLAKDAEAHDQWFLPLEYFETLFKEVRQDK